MSELWNRIQFPNDEHNFIFRITNLRPKRTFEKTACIKPNWWRNCSAHNACLTLRGQFNLSEPSIIYPVESITIQPKRIIDWSIKFVISITIFPYLKTKIRNQPSELHIRNLPLINLARSLTDDNSNWTHDTIARVRPILNIARLLKINKLILDISPSGWHVITFISY